jgi:hypothetical protein
MGSGTRLGLLAFVGVAALALARVAGAGTESPVWSSYLDYAYVYSSADAKSLSERLAGYGNEAGVSLDRYVMEYFETLAPHESGDEETLYRRKAIAYLLLYLSKGSGESLEQSVKAVRQLETRLDRHENAYWYHYIHANRALERGNAGEFVEEMLDLWLTVVVPLESTYQTLDQLALSDAPNSGFVSALPYVYENSARMITLRSQEKGVDRDLDPLGALVRLLYDKRVGAYPEVIPVAASSRQYLERIVQRMDGAESDVGSLTFTLALLEASKHHETARGLLAKEGLSEATQRALRTTAGAYEVAFKRARTVEGQCAVYTRVLREIGEVYAAKQRLNSEIELDMPFSIEGAIGVWATLRGKMDTDWQTLGYQNVSREQYLESMRRLWEEIQETSLNVADYYVWRSVQEPQRADVHARAAARAYGRYLGFFHQYATESGKPALPDSAYFAAFEASKGVGNALLAYATRPTAAEVALGTERYRSALILFPFDRELWPAITAGLGRHGRQADYAQLIRPIAEHVVRSRALAAWIDAGEPEAKRLGVLRRALADSEVVLYMGFAESGKIPQLEAEIGDLQKKRSELLKQVSDLGAQRDSLRTKSMDQPPASAADDGGDALADVAQKLSDAQSQLARTEQQIASRTRALPLFKATLETDGLAQELRARRDHPVHVLLRRMYHEGRPGEKTE